MNANNAKGLFQFTNKYTGNALGDFLLGDPTQGQVGLGGRGALLGRTNWIQTYLQDKGPFVPFLQPGIQIGYRATLKGFAYNIQWRIDPATFSK